MKNDEVKLFGLLIIESLREEDQKTGEILYQEVIKYKKFQEPNLSAFFYRINSKSEFFKLLSDTIEKIQNDKFFPVLHIEAHGSTDGIQLTSNEIITWDEIVPYFQKINLLLSNLLVINLGVCYGISLISKIDPEDRAPFRALVGATKEIRETEILVAFEAFYDKLFFSFDFESCLKLMNQSIDSKIDIFFLITGEYCFDQMVNPDRDPTNFQKIVSKHTLEQKLNNKKYASTSIEEVKFIVENEIRGFLLEAKEKKDYYLMKDITD
ncbi:MAG: hypothetical protein IPO39_05855 [Bacteroidetes bacterium]|nr:hypothetical protein [Bacteroidota bacterium]MBK9524272.1 hypothetical protein [Bacteroidota bacterium]